MNSSAPQRPPAGAVELRLLEHVEDLRPVGQAGERVEIGELVDALLGALPLGDVGEEAVPEGRAVRLAFGKGMGEDPFLRLRPAR